MDNNYIHNVQKSKKQKYPKNSLKTTKNGTKKKRNKNIFKNTK